MMDKIVLREQLRRMFGGYDHQVEEYFYDQYIEELSMRLPDNCKQFRYYDVICEYDMTEEEKNSFCNFREFVDKHVFDNRLEINGKITADHVKVIYEDVAFYAGIF